MTEAEFLTALRALPLHPGAHGLTDDTATLGGYTLTTDTLVEGVHFLPTDPPGDVAWKLIATNLSDLAAKGATPAGVLLNYPLRASPSFSTTPAQEHGVERAPHAQGPSGGRSDPMLAQSGDDRGEGQPDVTSTSATGPRPAPGWDESFLAGLATALTHFACPILGGDTVSLPANAPRVLTLTAIGTHAPAPPRRGARVGDALYVTGTIGDAGAGLAIAQGKTGPAELLHAYRRPQPRLAEGRALAPLVHAMMDISDGLLIDAERMATASGLGVTVDLASVPLSVAYVAYGGDRLAAATAGDDYELLFAAPAGWSPPVPATRIGQFAPGSGLVLLDAGRPVPLPPRLGYSHNS